MKSKISRILGVGLTIALVSSLLMMAAPASASDLLWSAQATPSALTFQVAAGTDASFLTVAPDGTTIFVVDSQAATDLVYKSSDSGLTWTPGTAPWAATAVTAIAVSPNYATDSTVVVTAGNLVYISTNGAATFGQLGGAVAAGEIITSLAIDPTYSAGGEIMVGTTNAIAATYGGVYIWNKSGVLNWVNQGALNEDVTSVAFSPNYPIDATILAVSSIVGFTRLHTKVSTFGWDATISALTPINLAGGVGDASAIVSSSLVMGSDYNGSVAATRLVYVATVSGLVTDDIYQVVSGVGATAMNPTTAADDAFVNLAFNGTVTAGKLFATQLGTALVYRCANPTANVGWQFIPPTTNPTGAANSFVALPPDFATSNTVYVGTTGAESAVSVSMDGGVNFYQTGMIDTVLNHFADFQASPAFATDNTLFLVTASAAIGTGDAVPESLWKSTNGGTTWIRVLALATVLDHGIVRPSPNYATDSTIYFAGTGAAATAIRLSNDGGLSWVPRISSKAINDLLVASATTVYVASQADGTVVRSTNGAWTWSTKTLTGSTQVFKLALAPNGDIIAGTDAGLVYRSTNSGTSFAVVLAGLGGGNVNQLAVDANYATNGAIYAASSAVALGVWRVQTGDIAWGQIYAGVPAIAAGLVSGLVTSADGSLYVADATVAAATTGGIHRSLTPTTLLALAPATFEVVTTGDGLTAGYTLQSLFGAPVSSTQLFAIENSGGAGANRVRTYTDTIVGAPVISLGSVSPTTAAFSWTGITGATSYQLLVNTRADFLGTAQVIAYVAPFTDGSATALTPGTTYYAMVRVAAAGVGAPVLSRWSNVVTLQAQMAAVAAPVGILPLPASQDINTKPSFSWGAVAGAASYTIELDTNPDFSGATTASVLINAWLSPETLEYSTTYYWRVTAISSSGAPASLPIVGVFTTEAEPAPPAPPAPIAEVATVTPISGATVAIEPTLVWTPYEGAIRYEVVVSTENDFSIIEYSHSVPVANTFYKSETLSYDTTYYWRVRGITGEQTDPYSPAPGSAWATGIFTTEAEPAPPAVVEKAEPLVIVQKEAAPPPVIVEVEKQVLIPAEPQAIPNYLLWTIIGIGSALILSLVVLIARTRRVT